MTTQLDLEKRKKRTDHSDTKSSASQVLFPPTPNEKRAKDTTDEQVFCVLCECYHKPNAKLRCAVNRALTKIESKSTSNAYGKRE
jgi:hypothetical protein